MPRYQIRFCDKEGHGSFKYFDAEENIENKASEVATDYIKNRIIRAFDSWKPPKKLDVWEMDMETKQPKSGGHRFKIQLHSVKATLQDGSKIGTQFYLPIKG